MNLDLVPSRGAVRADSAGWRSPRAWLLHLYWIPHAAFILYLIGVYAIDVPNIDQWDAELPFLQKSAEGSAGLRDLLAPHLEHRVLTNRVIGWLVAEFWGWNHQVECVFAWLLACGCAAGLTVLAGQQPGVSGLTRALQLTLLGALLFGLGQYANWLNCFGGIQWFAIEFYLIAGLLLARSGWPVPISILGSAFVALLATFSSANGFLVWFLLAPALLVSHRNLASTLRLRFSLAWGIVAVLAITGYFLTLQRSDGRDLPLLSRLGDPWSLLIFFLTNAGSPICQGTAFQATSIAQAVGTLVVVIFVASGLYLFRHRDDRDLLSDAIPWLVLVGYALGTGALVSIGRVHDGILEAIASRFMTIHNLGLIGLVFLLPIVLRHCVVSGEAARRAEEDGGPRGRSTWPRWLTIATPAQAVAGMASLVAAGTVIHLCHSNFASRFFPFYYGLFSRGRAAVLFSPCFQDADHLKWMWSTTSESMLRRADFLDTRGYLRPRLIRSPALDEVPSLRLVRTGGALGMIERALRMGDGSVAVSGWAILPDARQPAPAVVLTWETKGGSPTAFSVADSTGRRDDLVEKYGSSWYGWAGWQRNFKVTALPKGEITFRAWAFDVDMRTLYQLGGEFMADIQ